MVRHALIGDKRISLMESEVLALWITTDADVSWECVGFIQILSGQWI